MNLGIILSFGESIEILKKSGQYGRFLDYYLKEYSKNFEKVYVFSWREETVNFQIKNCFLVPNRFNLNPYLYNFLMPFIERDEIKECGTLRLMQFTPIIPAAISKKIYKSKIYCNYGFNYGSLFKKQGKAMKRMIWNLLERVFIKYPDIIAPAHKQIENFLIEEGVDKEKIVIIPNGADLDIFKPPLKRSFKNFNPDKKDLIKLLFVGRFQKEKNLMNLAGGIANSIYKNQILVKFIGDGEQKDMLEKFLREAAVKHIIIPPMPHKELAREYQDSDIFLLVSISEGYPKVLIEAMACGLPSLVSRYEYHSVIAQDRKTALLCNFDSRDISEKLDLLIGSTQLRKLISAQSRIFVEKNNNLKKIIKKEITLLKDLAKK